MTKEEVVALMKSSQSETEWNRNADTVIRHFHGYPTWWYSTVIVSGLLADTMKNW